MPEVTHAWLEDDGDAREIVERLAPHHTGAVKVSQIGGAAKCDVCGASIGGLRGMSAEWATVCACGTLLVARGLAEREDDQRTPFERPQMERYTQPVNPLRRGEREGDQ